jgi:hypothetical protein
MNRRMLIGVLASTFAFGGLVFAPLQARAGDDVNIAKKIAEAKTAADHEAISAHFDAEAKAAKAKAQYHTEMGSSYKKMDGALIEKQHMDRHCDAITASFEAIARRTPRLRRPIARWRRKQAAESVALDPPSSELSTLEPRPIPDLHPR